MQEKRSVIYLKPLLFRASLIQGNQSQRKIESKWHGMLGVRSYVHQEVRVILHLDGEGSGHSGSGVVLEHCMHETITNNIVITIAQYKLEGTIKLKL